MAGRTGYTPVTNLSSMEGPAQITDVYEHFDPLVDATVATASALPGVGFPGQRFVALDTGFGYIWLGGWKSFAEAGRQRAWRFPRAGSDSDAFPANSFASVASGTITTAPPGDYIITATAVCTNTATSVGYFRLTAAGTNLSLDMRFDVGGSPLPFSYTDMLLGFAGGDLAVDLQVQVAAGAGTVVKNGTGVRVAYLGRR